MKTWILLKLTLCIGQSCNTQGLVLALKEVLPSLALQSMYGSPLATETAHPAPCMMWFLPVRITSSNCENAPVMYGHL